MSGIATFFIFTAGWYAIGLLSVLICMVYHHREGIDLTIGDVCIGLMVSLLGPVLTIMMTMDWVQEHLNSNRVLIRGRKKTGEK